MRHLLSWLVVGWFCAISLYHSPRWDVSIFCSVFQICSFIVEKYSDSWYGFQESINDVKDALAQANIELIEYDNTMRDISWEHFDYLQDRISKVTDESTFLIDLMSHKNMYQDNGQLSDEGMSTMGLRAQNYNVYMAQADKYAKEIRRIDSAIAKDPYNTDLIERREELLKLQQESILASANEKDAIVELVRGGIEIELSSMKELINSYTDALDNAKDYYDYQRKIEKKSADIASLRKQLAAYENDTSEETRAKIQQIKVNLDNAESDLAETQYEQFVSDTKKLLDNLYAEYEGILNGRLDNVDALISDMIDSMNGNKNSINQTIEKVSGDVGYAMSQSLKDIWNSDSRLNDVVAEYGNNFDEKLTTINQALTSIQSNTAAMVRASDAMQNMSIIEQPANANTYGIDTSPQIGNMQSSHGLFTEQTMPTVQQTNTFNLGGISIDHVQDYNDLMRQIQHDPKFEKMIQSMTVDRIVGGSRLKKYNFRWEDK